MKLVFPIIFAFSMAYCVFSDDAEKPKKLKSEKIVAQINSDPNSLWEASTYGTAEIDVDQFVKTKLGLRFEKNASSRSNIAPSVLPAPPEIDELPKQFSWLDKAPKCDVGHIRNQANCGSCWAVATAAAFGDRICIHSKGKFKYDMSSEYIVGCDTSNYGCNGGIMERVNNFLKDNGTITGGDYESDEGCHPYSIKPCGSIIGTELPCVDVLSPKCRQHRCTNENYRYKVENPKRVIKAKSWVQAPYRNLDGNYTDYYIRKEIYENGPVTAGFLVYIDFMYYKKGIYAPTSNSYNDILGGHAVRIVGWGEENGVRYWLIANSWSPKWGENGFVRFIRGMNACEIESEIHGAKPDL